MSLVSLREGEGGREGGRGGRESRREREGGRVGRREGGREEGKRGITEVILDHLRACVVVGRIEECDYQ